jgi:tRNA pseudouridine55 synthase
MTTEGLLLLNKPVGPTSFQLVSFLRKKLQVKKIGHAGTLDPLASGLMVMLIGRAYTRQSALFLNHDKEYLAVLFLGQKTTTYDAEGEVVSTSTWAPTLLSIEQLLSSFQGERQQIPPMFSAKKVKGKKLYQLGRRGIEIPRSPETIQLTTRLIAYDYPYLTLHFTCSKGTYIRSLAQSIGEDLGCGAFLSQLTRLRSGPFLLKDSLSYDFLQQTNTLCPIEESLIQLPVIPAAL